MNKDSEEPKPETEEEKLARESQQGELDKFIRSDTLVFDLPPPANTPESAAAELDMFEIEAGLREANKGKEDLPTE